MFFTKLFYYYFEYEFYYTVEIASKLVINISKFSNSKRMDFETHIWTCVLFFWGLKQVAFNS